MDAKFTPDQQALIEEYIKQLGSLKYNVQMGELPSAVDLGKEDEVTFCDIEEFFDSIDCELHSGFMKVQINPDAPEDFLKQVDYKFSDTSHLCICKYTDKEGLRFFLLIDYLLYLRKSDHPGYKYIHDSMCKARLDSRLKSDGMMKSGEELDHLLKTLHKIQDKI